MARRTRARPVPLYPHPIPCRNGGRPGDRADRTWNVRPAVFRRCGIAHPSPRCSVASATCY